MTVAHDGEGSESTAEGESVGSRGIAAKHLVNKRRGRHRCVNGGDRQRRLFCALGKETAKQGVFLVFGGLKKETMRFGKGGVVCD